MAVGDFLCLCTAKSLQLVDGRQLKRSDNSDRLRADLESVDFGRKHKGKVVICLQGGGIAAEGSGSCPELAVEGPCLAVLSGTLQNYAYLVRKYFVTELGLPKTVSLEAIRQTTPLRDATMLCKLYGRMGTAMLPKLRGRFAFCLYDSAAARVLAVRDPSGGVPLVQGNTKDGGLFVASGGYIPPGALNVVDILPGKYKYGWRAPPRKFANPQTAVDKGADAAIAAATAALTGIRVPVLGSKAKKSASEGKKGGRATKEEVAYDGDVVEVPKFRTREEMRTWSARVAREAIQNYEDAMMDRNGLRKRGDVLDYRNGKGTDNSDGSATTDAGRNPKSSRCCSTSLDVFQRDQKRGSPRHLGQLAGDSVNGSSRSQSTSSMAEAFEENCDDGKVEEGSWSEDSSMRKFGSLAEDYSLGGSSEESSQTVFGAVCGGSRGASPVRYSPRYTAGDSVDGNGSSESEWSSTMTGVDMSVTGDGSWVDSRSDGGSGCGGKAMGQGLSNSGSSGSLSSSTSCGGEVGEKNGGGVMCEQVRR